MTAAAPKIPRQFRATLKEPPPIHMIVLNRGVFRLVEKEALRTARVTLVNPPPGKESKYYDDIKALVDSEYLCKNELDSDYVKKSVDTNSIIFMAFTNETQAIAVLKPYTYEDLAIEIDVLCSRSDSKYSNVAAQIIYTVANFANSIGKTHIKLKATKEAVPYYEKLGFKSYIDKSSKSLYPMYKRVSEILGNEDSETNGYNTNNWNAVGANNANMREKRLKAALRALKKQKSYVHALKQSAGIDPKDVGKAAYPAGGAGEEKVGEENGGDGNEEGEDEGKKEKATFGKPHLKRVMGIKTTRRNNNPPRRTRRARRM